jgi:hypothetical protein
VVQTWGHAVAIQQPDARAMRLVNPSGASGRLGQSLTSEPMALFFRGAL